MKRIESTQNALVKHWKKLVTTRKEREQSKEFMVEGFHLVEEALKQPARVLHLIVREGIECPSHWQLDGVQKIEVTEAVAVELTDTEASQWIFAHCRQPIVEEVAWHGWKKLLLVDAVQDPGNIGTMIRTADAAGIDAVVLGKGCADAYNPKTVRSAQGSHFHIPIVKGDLLEWVAQLQEQSISVLGTGLQQAVLYTELGTQSSFALIVGNEGSGVSPALLEVANQTVKIPMLGKAESLNVAVATGILLYGLQM